jgi:hypothetical protein
MADAQHRALLGRDRRSPPDDNGTGTRRTRPRHSSFRSTGPPGTATTSSNTARPNSFAGPSTATPSAPPPSHPSQVRQTPPMWFLQGQAPAFGVHPLTQMQSIQTLAQSTMPGSYTSYMPIAAPRPPPPTTSTRPHPGLPLFPPSHTPMAPMHGYVAPGPMTVPGGMSSGYGQPPLPSIAAPPHQHESPRYDNPLNTGSHARMDAPLIGYGGPSQYNQLPPIGLYHQHEQQDFGFAPHAGL